MLNYTILKNGIQSYKILINTIDKGMLLCFERRHVIIFIINYFLKKIN